MEFVKGPGISLKIGVPFQVFLFFLEKREGHPPFCVGSHGPLKKHNFPFVVGTPIPLSTGDPQKVKLDKGQRNSSGSFGRVLQIFGQTILMASNKYGLLGQCDARCTFPSSRLTGFKYISLVVAASLESC